IELILSIALIGIILLQRSKGEGLGAIGGSAQLFFDQPKGFDRTIVRSTAVLAAAFMLVSAALAFWP
ncbi:MAG TPA: preprotein translocase subunit SecG, partial [Limnochordia bacterium]